MDISPLKQEIKFVIDRIPDESGPQTKEALREILKILDTLPPIMTDEQFMEMLHNAPEDDEELDEEERAMVDEALAEIRAGKATPIDDLLAEHGML